MPNASGFYSVNDVVKDVGILILVMLLISAVIAIILILREKRKMDKWLKSFDGKTDQSNKQDQP